MIADLDETIRQLLIEELPIKNGEIDIKFDQPKREWSSRLSKPTLNFFLYDVRENATLRSHGWERIDNGTGRITAQKRTPMRIDCFYLMTSWAADPEDEHRLITRALMALFRFPIFPNERLIGTLRNPIFEISSRLAVHDRLTNPAEVWSALDNELRPSIPYIITLALDPWSEVTGPAIRTYTIRLGQAETLPRNQKIQEGSVPDEMIFLGGVVRLKTKDGAPQPGLQVAIKGTGWMDTTDEEGRFRFGSIPPGEYTLVAWPGGKTPAKPVERKVTIPAEDGNYDIILTSM